MGKIYLNIHCTKEYFPQLYKFIKIILNKKLQLLKWSFTWFHFRSHTNTGSVCLNKQTNKQGIFFFPSSLFPPNLILRWWARFWFQLLYCKSRFHRLVYKLLSRWLRCEFRVLYLFCISSPRSFLESSITCFCVSSLSKLSKTHCVQNVLRAPMKGAATCRSVMRCKFIPWLT